MWLVSVGVGNISTWWPIRFELTPFRRPRDIDIGVGRDAKGLAPARLAFEQLREGQEVKGLVVEHVSAAAGFRALVSVPGLPKSKLLEDMEIGAAVDGRVVTSGGRKIGGRYGKYGKYGKHPPYILGPICFSD